MNARTVTALAAVGILSLASLFLLFESREMPLQVEGDRTEALTRHDPTLNSARHVLSAPASRSSNHERAPQKIRLASFPGFKARTEALAATPLRPLLQADFPGSFASGWTVRHGTLTLRQRLISASPVSRTGSDRVARYDEVLPGIDAILLHEGDAAEEFLHRQPGAASTLTYEFQIESGYGRFDATYGLEVLDGTGSAVLCMPEIVYWRAGDDADEPRRADTDLCMSGSNSALLCIQIAPEDVNRELLIDPGWKLAGSMISRRGRHTTTLLADGSVLAAGGRSGSRVQKSAEMRNAATGQWVRTSGLRKARMSHAATRLSSGRVLLSGGSGDTAALSSVELYDPSSLTFEPVAPMLVARTEHACVLLPDGRVFVAGGSSGAEALSSCEIYNPATGLWSMTGSLTVPRGCPKAVLLSDGTVLIVGGNLRDHRYESSEIYDPASGVCSRGMLSGDCEWFPVGHTLTALPYGGAVVVGPVDGGYTTVAQVYSPELRTYWAPLRIASRAFHSASLLQDGRVLIAGGQQNVSVAYPLQSCEIFNPVARTIAASAPLSHPRQYHAAVTLSDGSVMISGGSFPDDASCEITVP